MREGPIQYRVRSKSQSGPNCMWKINRPDLGFVGEGYIFDVLKEECANYRRANGIPIGLGFEDELENALAEKYLESCPKAFTTDDPRAPLRIKSLGWADVLHGTQVMVQFIAAGKPVVSHEEAERRAAICGRCRFNVQFAKPCGGVCGELKAIVKAIVGDQKVSNYEKLNSCFICRCFLEAAVWLPLDIQVKPLTEFQKGHFERVQDCWKKESLIHAA